MPLIASHLTDGLGADSVLECVGTQQAMQPSIKSTRPGGYVGYVGVPHGVALDGQQLFFAEIHRAVDPHRCGGTCRT